MDGVMGREESERREEGNIVGFEWQFNLPRRVERMNEMLFKGTLPNYF